MHRPSQTPARSTRITLYTEIPEAGLIGSEKVLIEGIGRNREVWLTSLRLLVRRRAGWLTTRWETAEIALEDITEMSIGFVRPLPLIIIGAALVLVGVLTRAVIPNNVADTIWSLGIVITLLYVISGRRGLVVRSKTRQLRIKTTGAKGDEIREFVFTLEDARNRLAGVEGDAEDAGFRAGGPPASSPGDSPPPSS